MKPSVSHIIDNLQTRLLGNRNLTHRLTDACPIERINVNSRNLLFTCGRGLIVKYYQQNPLIDCKHAYRNEKLALEILKNKKVLVPGMIWACDEGCFIVMSFVGQETAADIFPKLDSPAKEKMLTKISRHYEIVQGIFKAQKVVRPFSSIPFFGFYKRYLKWFIEKFFIKRQYKFWDETDRKDFDTFIDWASCAMKKGPWVFNNADPTLDNIITSQGNYYLIDFEKIMWYPLSGLIVSICLSMSAGGITVDTLERASQIAWGYWHYNLKEKTNALSAECCMVFTRLGEMVFKGYSWEEAFLYRIVADPAIDSIAQLIARHQLSITGKNHNPDKP